MISFPEKLILLQITLPQVFWTVQHLLLLINSNQTKLRGFQGDIAKPHGAYFALFFLHLWFA